MGTQFQVKTYCMDDSINTDIFKIIHYRICSKFYLTDCLDNSWKTEKLSVSVKLSLRSLLFTPSFCFNRKWLHEATRISFSFIYKKNSIVKTRTWNCLIFHEFTIHMCVSFTAIWFRKTVLRCLFLLLFTVLYLFLYLYSSATLITCNRLYWLNDLHFNRCT